MFFRLIEVFMLRKQVGFPEVLYQNVIAYLFNRHHLFSMHSFFQEILSRPGGLIDFTVV